MSVQPSDSAPPVAILSFHSHGDRSFLDDRELAILSGSLSRQALRNDLFVTLITQEMEENGSSRKILDKLANLLLPYDPIVYERVWDPELIRSLRERLPDKCFIGLRGEHELLEHAPADYFCRESPHVALPALLQWLRGERRRPPVGTFVRTNQNSNAEAWEAAADGETPAAQPDVFAPNLKPIRVNPESFPAVRSFSILGNEGCPYQADARKNPAYAGVTIPDGLGRGCAFCVTGNSYSAHSNEETARLVFDQIAFVRRNAPSLVLLVLKDQNPFGYLTEVVERCAASGLSGFNLLLETRAEWFLRNERRFVRALAIAGRAGIKLSPFLVGIENFSQPELERFNKGILAEVNIRFLETLWEWKQRYGEALDLSHAAFGFILFTPWTTLDDLEVNLAGIRRTRLEDLRGSLLLSRARLYPDTALYYLAEHDGLLEHEYAFAGANSSRRYGYYPSAPWRHAHPEVAHFAQLATNLSERNANRDVVAIFKLLLSEFRSAGGNWAALEAGFLWQRFQEYRDDQMRPLGGGWLPADPPLLARVARLVHPLPLNEAFAHDWSFGVIKTAPNRLGIELTHPRENSFQVDLVAGRQGPAPYRSRHYLIRTREKSLTEEQAGALKVLAEAIQHNDR